MKKCAILELRPISKADKALYYVKQNGKNNYSWYNQIHYGNTANTSLDLQQIANSLQTSGNYSGALHLEYRDFTRQYEYIHQLMTRNQWNCYLVLVTMETVQDTLPYIEEIEGKLNVTCAGMPANLHSQVTFENFTEGAKYGGKLRPVHTAGGIVLDETEFTVRKG